MRISTFRRSASFLAPGSGLVLKQSRGERDYRGTIAGLDNVEVWYVSSSEIARELAQGNAHLGITGEDLIREGVDDATADRVVADDRERADRDRAAELVRHRRDDARDLLGAGRPRRTASPTSSWTKARS